MYRTVIAALFTALVAGSPVATQDGIKVVATFSILADIAKNIGGDRVAVHALVGPNSDAHMFSPSPADAKRISDAKMVLVNGLGFEGWLDRLVKASGTKAAVAVATKGIKARRTAEKHGHGHGHDHGATDPHAWQAVANVKTYATNIRDALIKVDPAGKAAYERNTRAYLGALDTLDKDIRSAVNSIPKDRRRIITSHDAFGYFAQAYGISFIAPQGISTDSQPSAKDVASIITQIKRQRIPAVFLENITDDRILKQIAKETGARIGGTLYSDALTDEKGNAPTYIDMMRHNIKVLSTALMS